METSVLIFIPGTILICATEKKKVILREIYRKQQQDITELNIILSVVLNPLKDKER